MTPIWQSPLWPRFGHDPAQTEGPLAAVITQLGTLEGLRMALPCTDQTTLREAQSQQEAAATLTLDGIPQTANTTTAAQTTAGQGPLTTDHLHHWYSQLFPDAPIWRSDPLDIIRTDKAGQEEVLYNALPPDRIPGAVSRFLDASNAPGDHPAPIRAALAYLWWDSIHPYDDGSSVIGRAIMRHLLPDAPVSQAMATDRRGHFAALQAGRTEGVGVIDGTAFVLWFLDRLTITLTTTMADTHNLAARNRVLLHLRSFPAKTLPPSTENAVIALFAQGQDAVAQGLNVALYAALAKVSTATASRHLTELETFGLITLGPDGGRSTRYFLAV